MKIEFMNFIQNIFIKVFEPFSVNIHPFNAKLDAFDRELNALQKTSLPNSLKIALYMVKRPKTFVSI